MKVVKGGREGWEEWAVEHVGRVHGGMQVYDVFASRHGIEVVANSSREGWTPAQARAFAELLLEAVKCVEAIDRSPLPGAPATSQ